MSGPCVGVDATGSCIGVGVGVVGPYVGVGAIEGAGISSYLYEPYDPTLHERIWLMCPPMSLRGIP